MEQLTFTADGLLWKAFVGDDKKTKYVVVKASDTGIDLQRDIIAESVFEEVIQDAKRGEIRLTASHHVPFGFGESVDAWTEVDPQTKLTSLYILFRLKDTYGEAHDLFNDVVNGKGNYYQVSVGGKILDYMHKADPKHGLVRVITKAKVNHVAVTWAGMAVNPRTGIIQAMAKALDLWEKSQLGSGWVLAKEKEDDDTEEEKEKGKILFEDAPDEDVEVKETLLKEFERLWDLLENEHRALTPTEEDLEEQALRFQKYQIEISPAGFATKPSVFAGVPEEKFADPVNYLFAIRNRQDVEMYLLAWQKNPQLWRAIYSDMESAGKVFANICRFAKEYGVKIPQHHPAIYLVPPTYVELISEVTEPAWFSIIHKSLVDETLEEEAKITGNRLLKNESDRETLYRKLVERAKKYGYDPAPNAHLTKPAEYAHIPESQFADPVGYNYPIDKEHVLAAIRYFLKPYNRNFYDPKAQKIIYERILRAMKRYGHTHTFDPDNPLDWLMPKSLKRWMRGYEKYEDEDTEEKRKEMEEALEREYKRYMRERMRESVRKAFEFPYATILSDLLNMNPNEAFEQVYQLLSKADAEGYPPQPYAMLEPEIGKNPDDFADPVSLRYPITSPEEATDSYERFMQERHFYHPDAQLQIYKRILQAMKKNFDPSNPLDWLVAAEDPTILEGSPSEIPSEQIEKCRSELEKEFIEKSQEEMEQLNSFLTTLDYLRLFVLRRKDFLSKTLTTESATAGGERGIFGYWVVGQENRKAEKVGPITYVVPVEKFPLRSKGKKKEYPVTDLSVPIAVVKEAVEKVAEKIQKLEGAVINVEKAAGDGSIYEITVFYQDQPVISYNLRLEDDEIVLEEKFTIEEINHQEVVKALHLTAVLEEVLKKNVPSGGSVEVELLSPSHIIVGIEAGNERKCYAIPYEIDDEGIIHIDYEQRQELEIT